MHVGVSLRDGRFVNSNCFLNLSELKSRKEGRTNVRDQDQYVQKYSPSNKLTRAGSTWPNPCVGYSELKACLVHFRSRTRLNSKYPLP